MIFFNIDLHVAVIADIRNIFSRLGHTVIDKSLSDYTFAFGRRMDAVDVINKKNWKYLDEKMCNDFYDAYKDRLKDYDGFICTYPPSFSLLYEKFNKPIIIQAPIRFEVPFQNDPVRHNRFLDYLKNGIDNKQIIPICNSLYEKKYCERFTEREWNLIPNICDYTGIDYTGGEKYIVYNHFDVGFSHSMVVGKKHYLGKRYKWSAFNSVKGVIHFPYNVSTMSIYEQYTGNVPLLFPSLKFNMDLYKQGLTMSDISWNKNKLDSVEWIGLSDFYNSEWMPHIQCFDSLDDLSEKVETLDTERVSGLMREFNVIRKNRIYNKWTDVLNGLVAS